MYHLISNARSLNKLLIIVKPRAVYLDQSSVPVIIQILINALFPVTSKDSRSCLRAWGTLASTSTCITFWSRWTCRTRWSLRSFVTWRALASTSASITLLPGKPATPAGPAGPELPGMPGIPGAQQQAL